MARLLTLYAWSSRLTFPFFLSSFLDTKRFRSACNAAACCRGSPSLFLFEESSRSLSSGLLENRIKSFSRVCRSATLDHLKYAEFLAHVHSHVAQSVVDKDLAHDFRSRTIVVIQQALVVFRSWLMLCRMIGKIAYSSAETRIVERTPCGLSWYK